MERVQPQHLAAPDAEDKLVQLGVRIPRSLHLALKAAAFQQERFGRTPRTQAEIVTQAIEHWLRSNDYDEGIHS
jgi:hypothetical protein